MLNSKAVIYLYTGGRLDFARKATRFDILCLIANHLRTSPELFKYAALFSKSERCYCLSYSKKNLETNMKGVFYYRFVAELMNLEDVSFQCPEVFNYIYLQAVDDLRSDFTFSENGTIYSYMITIKLVSLGFSVANESTVVYTMQILGLKHTSNTEVVENVTKLIPKCLKNLVTFKLEFIKLVQGLSPSACTFQCDTDKQACTAEVTRSDLRCEGYNLPLEQMDRVTFSFKHHVASVFTQENARFKELIFPSKPVFESFLTILDMSYKTKCPGNLILDHKLTDDFNFNSLVYHDHNYTIPHPDNEHKKLFNYSLVDNCSLVVKIKDKSEAEKILRFPGNKEKFLVVDNFLEKEAVKCIMQYYFFILISDRLVIKPIVVGDSDGRFKIDDVQKYLTLYKLFTQITIMEKIGDAKEKRKRALDVNISKEDMMRIAEHEHIYNVKSRGEPSLSALNIAITSAPQSINYLYAGFKGVLHSADSIKRVSVTQFITHDIEYGNFILCPIVEHIKGLRVRGISHPNVCEIVGVFKNRHRPCLVEEDYEFLLNHYLSCVNHSIRDLYSFGRQIVAGIRYLHKNKIVHGFPALHNMSISRNLVVKIKFVGILPELVRRRDVYNTLLSRDYLPQHFVSYGHPARWLHRSMIFSNAPWNIEVDRYVFGCTLWQLYNKGAIPLSDKSDQEILDKLEGKDSWFNGGTYFRLPRAGTEFLNKLQKIINVCVTWGNKDNLEKYEFSKIADAYEKLGDVVNIEDKTSSDFILKAENGKLDFNVNITDSGNNKYTLVEEDNNTQVILVRNKKSPPDLPPPNVSGGQFNQVRDMLKDEDKLLQLSDLQGPEGGKFVIPAPGDPEREAVCSKVVINKKVWVKSYSKCKNVPEQDFLAEVKNLLTFKHPNIVPLRGCVILPEVLLLITPSYSYCNSLRGYINNKHHAITDKKRESYALQICTGMKYLAEHKCVHRNLRLSHVYLTNYNEVVITNFGLARVTEGLYYQQQRILSSDTFVIYPPEVISVLCGDGKVKFNSGCDVWSYGVLLWELYSSEVAYNNVVMDLHGNPDINLLDGFFRDGESLQIDPGWPDKIRKVITKCLSEEQSRVTFSGIEEILVE